MELIVEEIIKLETRRSQGLQSFCSPVVVMAGVKTKNPMQWSNSCGMNIENSKICYTCVEINSIPFFGLSLRNDNALGVSEPIPNLLKGPVTVLYHEQ